MFPKIVYCQRQRKFLADARLDNERSNIRKISRIRQEILACTIKHTALSLDRTADILLYNDCIVDKGNASGRCLLLLVSYEELDFRIVPLANLDTIDAEYLPHS